MHSPKILAAMLATTLSTLTSAAPATDPNVGLVNLNNTSINATSILSTTANATDAAVKQAVPGDIYCAYMLWPFVTQWEISYFNDHEYNGDHCGHGLLQNVKHSKCLPTGFKCKHLDDKGHIRASFNSFSSCLPTAVSASIFKSTHGKVDIPCFLAA